MSITISWVTPDRRSIALRLLFARFPVEEQQTRLADTLRSAERGSLNLDRLLLAEEHGQPVGAALTMLQADGITLVWPPVITCQTTDATRVEDALMQRMCDDIDLAGSKLAQVLLAPDDDSEMHLLERHGFAHMADMYFLARILNAEDAENSTDTVDFDYELFHEANRERFSAAIEHTYQESLDCPFLNGFRNGRDAIESHRLSGCFDPAGWRLYRTDSPEIASQDIGVLLMNEHPEQNAIELVYFGIAPEFRGRGLGRMMLTEAIQAAALTHRAVIFLAVDCGNIYANNLYNELGFVELAQRRVMVRRRI